MRSELTGLTEDVRKCVVFMRKIIFVETVLISVVYNINADPAKRWDKYGMNRTEEFEMRVRPKAMTPPLMFAYSIARSRVYPPSPECHDEPMPLIFQFNSSVVDA